MIKTTVKNETCNVYDTYLTIIHSNFNNPFMADNQKTRLRKSAAIIPYKELSNCYDPTLSRTLSCLRLCCSRNLFSLSCRFCSLRTSITSTSPSPSASHCWLSSHTPRSGLCIKIQYAGQKHCILLGNIWPLHAGTYFPIRPQPNIYICSSLNYSF